MGKLVIVESPTKAKKIQGYLGSEYVVKSSKGHIRDLPDKSLSVDVADGFRPEYVIPDDKKALVEELKKDVAKSELVLLASDEDREGEAIAWHLSDVLGLNRDNSKRIVFHEVTKPAILEAVEHPRDIDMNLVAAQQARRVLDRLVGFELSPVLWKKIQPRLSAGRVQSVALRLIVDREREIESFKSEPFYKVEGIFVPEGNSAALKGVLDTRFSSESDARTFLEMSIGSEYRVGDVTSREGRRSPAAPFTTSTLQQEAVRKLGMGTALTMQTAQKLYEEGLITYMRTDSFTLSPLAVGAAKQYITENFGVEYVHTRQYRTRSRGAQEAHEAIRPTFIKNREIQGTPAEKRLYELIWRRTVASQMEDAKVMNTEVTVVSDKVAPHYVISGSKILFDGFLKLYTGDERQEEEGVELPAISPGTRMREKGITAECKFTTPPSRYSQGTLVARLEELGIGRPSTYSTIITTLMKGRGYILEGDREGRKVQVTNYKLKGGTVTAVAGFEKTGAEKKRLFPQDIGLLVADFLKEHFPDIMDYQFTADVEKQFDDIAEGGMDWDTMIADFYTPFHDSVTSTVRESGYSRLEREIGRDPSDGRMMVARLGQFGPYVQKGEGDDRICVSLRRGQVIESLTVGEAARLFRMPRNLGSLDGTDVIVNTGRYGPFIKYGDRNVSIKGAADPYTMTLEDAESILSKAAGSASEVISRWDGIRLMNGRYGSYLKVDGGQNYKLPKGTDPATLTEAMAREIIASSEPSTSRRGYHRRNR